MEYWEQRRKKIIFDGFCTFKPIIPPFHYSSIPIVSEANRLEHKEARNE
jgi:hypothetical protein